MYVIIPASSMETALVSMSEPMCKTLVPINRKPVLQYILDELYSYQAFIDEIIIVKDDVSDIEEYLKYNKQDDFFLTKIHCLNGKNYTQPNTAETSFFDDFYTGMEHLVDDLKVRESEVLVWSADELVFDSRRLIDQTIGSFVCSYKNKPIKIYRFDDWVNTVNNLVLLKRDGQPHTIQDFLNKYKRNVDVTILRDFGSYKVWDNKVDYYKLQSELIATSEYSSVFVDIDLVKEQITKTNKYQNLDYSYTNNELSRAVQYNLWSEADFINKSDDEQGIFLPKLIEQGVNQRGEYCHYVVEEFIYGNSLDAILLNEKVTEENWNFILSKIVSILKEVFHNDDLEDDDELYHSYVPKKIREKHIDEYRDSLNNTLSELSSFFSKENQRTNYYFLSHNEIVEWKMFFDEFFDAYIKNSTKDDLIYNGTCGRLVHSNLFFENIVYDTFANNMTFINPRSRSYDIVNKNKDFATLYLSCYCGLDALLNGRYTTNYKEITISQPVQQQMDYCLSVLDELFDDVEFLRMYAIILMFEMANSNKLTTEKKVALLRYASQLKLSLIKNRMFN